MPPLRSLAACLLCAVVLVLGACGGGGGAETAPASTPAAPAPAPVQVDSARIARATIGTAGGSVTATAADGRSYTLTVPAGALAAATEITATPVLTMGDAPLAAGLKGAVRFGPAGLRFAAPATLRIEGASTAPAAGTSLVGFTRSADGRSMALGLPVVRGSALELQVRHFSDVGVSQATPQQVAAVPAAAEPAETADSVINAIFDALGRGYASVPADRRTVADEVAIFTRVHDALVAPRLRAAALTTPAGRDLAIAAAQAWLVFTALTPSFDEATTFAALPGGLGALATTVQQQLLGVLTTNFDAGLAECTAEPPSRPFQQAGLVSALRAAQVAVELRNNRGGLPGLDAGTVARRLNDCVRVVFVPRPLPAFEVGRQASLDVQAQLIFANSASTPERALFAFTLSSDDAAIANPQGFSDTQGAYTSVVTARVSAPRFSVGACMVIVDDIGRNIGSSLCGATTLVGGPEGVVLVGQATRSFSPPVNNGSFSVQGTVDFRVRAEANGRFTVLEARGTVTELSSGDGQCSPDGGLTTITRRLTDRKQHTVTGGSHSSGRFSFRGSTTRTVEFMVIENGQSDCSLQTSVFTEDNTSLFGVASIISIELGADGKPLVVTLGGVGEFEGQVTGRLTRE